MQFQKTLSIAEKVKESMVTITTRISAERETEHGIMALQLHMAEVSSLNSFHPSCTYKKGRKDTIFFLCPYFH